VCSFFVCYKSRICYSLTSASIWPLSVCAQLQETARRIAKISVEAKLEGLNEDDYVELFRPHLMDVVHSWCKGSSFAQICQMTDVFEGIA